MKRIIRFLVVCFLFLFTFIVVDGVSTSAKSVSNSVFEIEVGGDKLPVYYELVEDNGTIKEMLKFPVELRGLESNGNKYEWRHTLCYKVVNGEEVCEEDVTINHTVSKDGEKITEDITSDKSYNFVYFDEDMPYYSDSLEFEYLTFNNKLVCRDCNSSTEYTFPEIKFLGSDVDYTYKFNVVVNYYEKDGKKYGGYNTSALFINSSESTFNYSGAPTYSILNEMCVGDNDCHSAEYKYVSNEAGTFLITPYIGNINFPYDSSSKYRGGDYENITYRTTLKCYSSNCENNRRVSSTSLVVYEETFSFAGEAPYLDTLNSKLDVYSEVTFVKSSEIKLTVKDDNFEIDNNSLKYYIGAPFAGYCEYASFSEYSFTNGESFTIGEGKSGQYCMYYEVANKLGNNYISDYYIFYFDNTGPNISSMNNIYDSSKYYNEIGLSPVFVDSYSGFKNAYYLWSKDEITMENYLDIKNKGVLLNGSITSSGIDDGTYNLYILGYDNLDNYKAYNLGVYNIDTTALNINDIVVSSEFIDDFNNTQGVTVEIGEMGDNEAFKCAFISDDNVVIDDLTNSCVNNSKISLPGGLEGSYDFYIYVHDRADNYSLIKLLEDIKVDTIGPKIDYSILYDDNEYRIVNEISVSVTDLVGVNSNSLKYGWFASGKSNVVSSDLTYDFENNGIINYPISHYGDYKLYLKAVDNIGNETFVCLGKVFKIDTSIIRISLVGEKEITIIRGEKYNELGAKAYKGEIGSSIRVSDINIDGDVNIDKVGTYYVTYSSGEGDLLVSVTRKVVVKSDSSYIVISGCVFGVGVLITSLRLFIRRKKEQII